jgi:DNA-binding NarL/FixJ family response regulator
VSVDAAVIALFVVAEDPYARSGIRAAIEADPDMSVVGEAEEPSEELIMRRDVDLVVLDLGADPSASVPYDLDWDDMPFLALAGHLESAKAALASGAGGVVSRQSDTDRIVAAARAVHAGLRVVDAEFSELLEPEPEPEAPIPLANLTPREQEVLELMARGLSNPEIAEELGVTRHTAKFHVKAILDKLGAQTRTEAVVLAARNGLLHL